MVTFRSAGSINSNWEPESVAEMNSMDRINLIADAVDEGRTDDAVALCDEALADWPSDERVLRAKAIALRKGGRTRQARAHLQTVLASFPNAGWAHAQYAVLLTRREIPGAVSHLRKAHALEPKNQDFLFELIWALGLWWGPGEGEALEEAYQLLRPLLPESPNWEPERLHVAHTILSRVCAFDELASLGSLKELGRKWAEAGLHTALLWLMPRVSTDRQNERELRARAEMLGESP
jgi:protein O-GlcNAc transferase